MTLWSASASRFSIHGPFDNDEFSRLLTSVRFPIVWDRTVAFRGGLDALSARWQSPVLPVPCLRHYVLDVEIPRSCRTLGLGRP